MSDIRSDVLVSRSTAQAGVPIFRGGFRMRCLLAVAFLVAVLALLSGCMVAHHQHTPEDGQETSAMARPHDSQESLSVETSEQKPDNQEQSYRDDGGMPMMMHGAGSWHWLMGGAMVVMMALVIL